LRSIVLAGCLQHGEPLQMDDADTRTRILQPAEEQPGQIHRPGRPRRQQVSNRIPASGNWLNFIDGRGWGRNKYQ
jgi:hypothetical protein